MRTNTTTYLTLSLSIFLLAAPVAWGQSAPPDVGTPPADAAKTPSGVYSKVLESADPSADRPDGNDVISVSLTAWTADGQLFQSSDASGQPVVFNLAQVFPGWREVMTQMRVGEKRRIWVPEAAGPQAQGRPGQGPKGTLTFEVQLLGKIDLPQPPADLGTPPTDAQASSLGARSKVLTKGTGTENPIETSAVLLNYTGWTANGQIFDSSLTRFRPTLIPLEKVMPAFSEVVREMVEGEKRRIWIPGSVAKGNWQGSPRGDLTFEVELLRIGDGSKMFAPAEEGGSEG